MKNKCIEWDGYKNKAGYGVARINGKNKMAHRVQWEKLIGKIPNGLVIDHLCRNTSCVNVKHLRVCTTQENILAGFGSPAMNKRKKSCTNGHKLTKSNLYIQFRKNGRPHRLCRVCHIENAKQRRLANPEQHRKDALKSYHKAKLRPLVGEK